MGLSLDICFGGGGSVFLKLSFIGGWGWIYFQFLGDYFFIFSVLWRKFINICLTFTHSFTQFFFI